MKHTKNIGEARGYKMRDINQLAKQFRNAIEKAKDAGEFDNDFSFWKFPRGCCGDTCDLLAQFLMENGIRTHYVCGVYRPTSYENIQTHAWLITDDHKIIDITGDQFKEKPEFLNYDKPIYIGIEDDFHKLFTVESRNIHENNEIDVLGSMCQPRLKKLYRIIISHFNVSLLNAIT